MEKLLPQVIEWAEESNIVKGSTIEAEVLKLITTCRVLTQLVDKEKPASSVFNILVKQEVCINGIGSALIQMVIICRMRNISLYECVGYTKEITDERIGDPQFIMIMIMRYLSELSSHIHQGHDIKADIGYLLIFFTSLGNILELSPRDCMHKAFIQKKDHRFVIFNGEVIPEEDKRYEEAKRILNYSQIRVNDELEKNS